MKLRLTVFGLMALLCGSSIGQGKTLLEVYGPWSKEQLKQFASLFHEIENFCSHDRKKHEAAATILDKVDTPTLVHSFYYGRIPDFEYVRPNGLNAYETAMQELFDLRIKDLVRMLNGSVGDQDMAYRLINPKWRNSKVALPAIVENMRNGSELAARKLDEFGPKARPTIPTLKAMLLDPACTIDATIVLASIGPEAVPALSEALHSPDPVVRARAVAPLIVILENANPYNGAQNFEIIKEMMPLLIAILQDPSFDGAAPHKSLSIYPWRSEWPSVPRSSAAFYLGRIANENKEAVTALASALKDGNTRVCLTAADGLGGIGQSGLGESAGPAMPSLVAALSDDRGEVRTAAANALVRLGNATYASLPAIRGLLSGKDWDKGFTAAYTLSHFGTEGSAALPILVAGLSDPRSGVKARSSDAIVRLQNVAKPSLAAIRGLLTDRDGSVRIAAAGTLSYFGEDGGVATPELVAELSDPTWDIRHAAADSLGRLGSWPAKDSLPALHALITAKDLDTRLAAAIALSYFGGDGAAAVPALIEGLQAKGESQCHSTIQALARLGSLAKDAVPALREALKGDKRRPEFSSDIEQALRQITGTG